MSKDRSPYPSRTHGQTSQVVILVSKAEASGPLKVVALESCLSVTGAQRYHSSRILLYGNGYGPNSAELEGQRFGNLEAACSHRICKLWCHLPNHLFVESKCVHDIVAFDGYRCAEPRRCVTTAGGCI